jgi:hypothetical protein
MKALIVSTLLVFLAGCSSMGASFGSSMGGAASYGSGGTNDEGVFHSYDPSD